MSLKEGSYRIQNFASDVHVEIGRLEAQVKLFWEKEYRCLRMFGLRDGMRILDCGCGPGHVLEKLLQSLPASRVTGVEIDPFLARMSKERLAALGGDRVHVLEQSVMEMGFADNSFDFAIGRMVLEHLPDPLKAVKEVHRVLKKGGKAVFIDNDFGLHLRAYPDIPELQELYEAYCRCRIAEGGKPRIGRELPGILQEGGFSKVDLEIVSAHSRLTGDEVFLKSEGSGIPAKLVGNGYLSREALDRLARKWHGALQADHHVFFRQLFAAGGEKPSSQAGRPQPRPEHAERRAHSPRVCAIPETGSLEKGRRNLTDYLRIRVGALLETAQELLPLDRPLIGLGMDSFRSVELANRIETDLGIRISAVDVLEAQSIHAIAAHCDAELGKRKQAGSAWAPTHRALSATRQGPSHRYDTAGQAENENGWEEGYL